MAGIDIISDSTGKEIVAAIQSTDVAQARILEINTAAEAKKNEVLESIQTSVRSEVANEVAEISGRLDNIIAHNQDTNGNSELIDLRTDINGVTHESAGSAVRSQVNELKGDLTDSKVGFDKLNYYAKFENGDLSNGTLNNKIKYRVATNDLISFDRDISLLISSDFKIRLFYFVDGDYSSYSNWSTNRFVIPANTVFKIVIRRSVEDTEEIANVNDFVSALQFETKIYEDIRKNAEIINRLDLDFKSNVNQGKYQPEFIDDVFVKWKDGTTDDDTTYFSTDYIPVVSGFIYNLTSRVTSEQVGYAFYDSDKQYISGATMRNTESGVKTFTAIAPQNAKYVRFSGVKSYKNRSYFEMVGLVNGIINKFNEIDTKLKNENIYWVFHLDCARKYFTVDNVKVLIDKISSAGFNQLQIHFSEDSGFRFALDDMTVIDEDGNTYDLTPCLGGNENSTMWFTRADMDTIINYAQSKNIDIVPSLDMPGHMGRILNIFSQFKYNGSNTLDITNDTAVKFAKAIVNKYAKYFASRGCNYWNIGYDEIVGSTGFDTFYTEGNYQKVVDFANELIDVVKKYNMTPRIYNEPVYYNKDYKYYIRKDAEIYYWYTDWAEYTLPDEMMKSGYKLINNTYAYYWILDKPDSSVTVDLLNSTDLLRNFYHRTTTEKGSGATLCVWCDSANTSSSAGDGGDSVVSSIAPLIEAFGNAIKRSLQ